MKTVFQITFPQEPGAAFPIEDSRGRPMPVRARSDFRRTNVPTRPLTRDEWDDQRRPTGYYMRPYRNKVAVPNVDFEAEDGTIHQTAEACLAHELKTRFGVETLDEVQRLIQPPVQPAEPANALDSLDDDNGNPPFSSVPVEPEPPIPLSQDEAVRLLASALSRRGLKHSEAAKATGMTSQQCRAIAAANPEMFRDNAGKLFLTA